MAESAPHRMAAESSGRHRKAGPVDRRARSGRRLRLISTVGLGVGLLLLAIPFGAETLRTVVWGGGAEPQVGVPAAVASPPGPESTPVAEPTPDGVLPTGTPGATPTATPTPTSRADGAPASTPPAPSTSSRPPIQGAAVPTSPATTGPPPPAAPPPPPQPVLLGPDGRDGLARMMDRYCDEHVGVTSWADTRGDGGWECDRLLLSSRTVDIDLACRDTYGDGAFAQNPEGRDPFGWRCFRR
ncbi:hypothetical protein GCM10022225_41310 [Plantactinospora mayteni]|uniref:Uncharacterized protein n=1 Tax=Plantactinospora mayteni TaxID=566021 RepID=A0ABQ4EU21_9ACTN|nr:hypothetical protein [Plantactinospora mayteni]GIG98155.1 hypothetical protein Pma05_47280 [Plantactinospora mayteni]